MTATTSPAVPVVATVGELVALGLDFAVVASPTGLHSTSVSTLAAAGVHTLIEKPLAGSTEGARNLVEAFKTRNLIGAVGHIERYNPALRALRDPIGAGRAGGRVSSHDQSPRSVSGTGVADVGVVKDFATHDIDLMPG